MGDQRQNEPDRLDWSPLDPRADAAGFETLIREVRRAAAPELARRRAKQSLWDQIASWWRPILVGSGVLAVVSAGIVILVHPARTAPASLPEAFGVPSQVAHWVQATENPSPGELLGGEWSAQ
jgi:hypothetical protein